MSFLVAINGQFSLLDHHRPVDHNVRPVAKTTLSKEVQEFDQTLATQGEAIPQRSNPAPGVYQKADKYFEQNRQRFYAKDLMSSPVHTIDKSAPLAQAQQLLKRHGFRHLPVLGEQQLICGLLSEREIYKNDASQTCGEVMLPKVIVCEERTSVHEIAIILLREKINALPVVNQHKQLTGIITLSDILKHVIQTTPFLSQG
jgi:CBS-domain-containing membrane protein